MAEMYMKNIRDWREATLMLSFEEKGYYDELLNLIYIYDDCLPDHDDLICRAMPVHKKTHLRLKAKLIELGLISIKSGFYFNKRAAAEIGKINEISEKNKLKAHSRWAKTRKNKDNNDAAAEPAEQSGIAGEMLKVNVKCESDVSLINKNKDRNNRDRIDYGKANKPNRRKCSIEDVLNPDGEIPEEYRTYAEEQGLSNYERVFTDWAN